MQSVLAVVVTYNRKDMLVRCLDALVAQTSPLDVLVVNNASTDGTGEILRARCGERLFAVDTGENLGGAGGFVRGIEEALRRDYRRIWIMDDDVIPEPDALEKLLEADAAFGADYGWLSSRCETPDGTICPMNLQRRTPFSKLHVDALDAGADPAPARMASFVSLFFRAETVRRFGLPVAEFFIWSDDLEWTRRVSRELPCYAIPKSTVVHAITGSAASNVAIDTPERVPRYFYAFRNEFYVYRREGVLGLGYYFAKAALNLLRIAFKSGGHRLLRLRTILSGVVCGLFFRPNVKLP